MVSSPATPAGLVTSGAASNGRVMPFGMPVVPDE